MYDVEVKQQLVATLAKYDKVYRIIASTDVFRFIIVKERNSMMMKKFNLSENEYSFH